MSDSENNNKLEAEETNQEGEQEPSLEEEAGNHLYELLFSEGETYLAILPSMIVGSGPIVLFYFFGKIVQQLSIFSYADQNNMKVNVMPEIEKYGWWMVGFSIFIAIARFFDIWLWFRVSSKLSTKIRDDLFHNMMKSEVTFFDTNSIGSILKLLLQDAQKVQDSFGLVKGIEIASLAQFLLGIILSFVANWKLALIMICEFPAMFILASLLYPFMTENFNKVSEYDSKLVTIAEETFSSIKTVKSFNAEDFEHDRFSDNGLNSAKCEQKAWYWAILSFSSSDLVNYSMIIVLLYLGAYWINRDGEKAGFTIGDLTSFFGYSLFSSMGLFFVQGYLEGEGEAVSAGARILKMTKHMPKVQYEGGIEPETFNGEIEFKNVSFKYPTRDQMVLKNVSFKVEPNKFAAFVGHSGSGKSTVIQLLERFYDVTEGEILIDGHNIKEYNPRWLHKKIGLVSQDTSLFLMSIKDNIKYGYEEATEEEVVKAAEIANAKDFIERFDKKYETLVGEKGSMLSGGQKQRIAIARAVIKNPTILITDEATSALDAANEKQVQLALDKVMENRTAISVAHRLSTIQKADIIYVFNDGKIVEQGKHKELVEKKGIYYGLVSKQLQDKSSENLKQKSGESENEDKDEKSESMSELSEKSDSKSGSN